MIAGLIQADFFAVAYSKIADQLRYLFPPERTVASSCYHHQLKKFSLDPPSSNAFVTLWSSGSCSSLRYIVN